MTWSDGVGFALFAVFGLWMAIVPQSYIAFLRMLLGEHAVKYPRSWVYRLSGIAVLLAILWAEWRVLSR
jgi:hypothetical protein